MCMLIWCDLLSFCPLLSSLNCTPVFFLLLLLLLLLLLFLYFKVPIDITEGIQDSQARQLAADLEFKGEALEKVKF